MPIIGSGGAGKSTLAAELGGILGLKVIHLDAHFWNPGWVPTPRRHWIETVEKLKSRDAWIMDGHYGSTLEMRLEASDAVVFLDFPKSSAWWAIRRRLQNIGVSRPDMAPGRPERFLNWEFLKFLLWIWRFPRVQSPSVVKAPGLLGHQAHHHSAPPQGREAIHRGGPSPRAGGRHTRVSYDSCPPLVRSS